jgi:hypothetical protein
LSVTPLILLLPVSQTIKDCDVSSKSIPFGLLKRAIFPIASMCPLFCDPARVETSPGQQKTLIYWMIEHKAIVRYTPWGVTFRIEWLPLSETNRVPVC